MLGWQLGVPFDGYTTCQDFIMHSEWEGALLCAQCFHWHLGACFGITLIIVVPD